MPLPVSTLFSAGFYLKRKSYIVQYSTVQYSRVLVLDKMKFVPASLNMHTALVLTNSNLGCHVSGISSEKR